MDKKDLKGSIIYGSVICCGMGAAVEFGLALTAILKGEPAAENIASAVFAK